MPLHLAAALARSDSSSSTMDTTPLTGRAIPYLLYDNGPAYWIGMLSRRVRRRLPPACLTLEADWPPVHGARECIASRPGTRYYVAPDGPRRYASLKRNTRRARGQVPSYTGACRIASGAPFCFVVRSPRCR